MNKKHYIIPIFVPHEGCPHNCVFCNQDSITGSTNKVTGEFVRNTIEEYLLSIKNNKHKASTIEVSFFGGTFTAINIEKQRELLSVAKEYKENGEIDFIRLSTRPDYIDEKILDHLKSYLVDIIELGVQSLDEEVLHMSGRGHSAFDVVKASELIKKYEMTLGHQIMLGLPGDNFQRDIETTKKVISMKPHICRIYPALTVKNTPMEKMYLEGVYKPYSLEEAVEISKEVYSMLTNAGIKVIRLGLQPTEEISEGGEVVSGPFHSAFRELVEASLIKDAIGDTIEIKDYSGELEIILNPRDISKLYTNKKSYFKELIKKYKDIKIKVSQSDEVERNELILKGNRGNCLVKLEEYLEEKYS